MPEAVSLSGIYRWHATNDISVNALQPESKPRNIKRSHLGHRNVWYIGETGQNERGFVLLKAKRKLGEIGIVWRRTNTAML